MGFRNTKGWTYYLHFQLNLTLGISYDIYIMINFQVIKSMSEGEKCGLSSLIPMSCRGKAEAFARTLHKKLRSLGSEDDNGSSDESSWLAANESSIAISQPRHGSDSDIYFDFGILESPSSPEEEIEETELHKLLNKDNLNSINECQCTKSKGKNSLNAISNSSDSDDGPFYDTESFAEERLCSGSSNSEGSKSTDNETGIDVDSDDISNPEESFVTTSECTPHPSVSLSDDISTLSLGDEEYSSLEINSTSVQNSNLSLNLSEKLYAKCNGTSSPNTDQEFHIDHQKIDIDLTIECTDAKEPQISIKIEQVDKYNETESNELESDELESDERPERVRRCSSLKTGKTPPGTPGSKKIVRFADALGLDLAECRTFLDEIPKIPISAYEDLSVDLRDPTSDSQINQDINKFHGIRVDKILMPLFQQPGGMLNFLDRVRENQVCLENAVVDDPVLFSVKGTVRVRNLDFHKSVHIRYTLNTWKTFADVQATYVDNSCDGFSDKFAFVLYAHTLNIGQRLELACRFQAKGCQYWDNNNGANYCFQCLPATNQSTVTPVTNVDDWGASFY